MMTQTIERPVEAPAVAARTPERDGSHGVARRPADPMAGIDGFIARLLAAAEDSVAGTSYAAARRRILRHLESRGPLSTRGIARTWPVTPQHLAHLVHELEQDGLVESAPDGDGTERFRLTADGAAALAATRKLQLDLIANLLGARADGDTARAEAIHRRLRAALDSENAGS